MPKEPRSHGNVSAERRRALLLIGGTAVAIAASGGGCATGGSLFSSRRSELADAANLTKQCWDTDDYERFVRLLPDEQLWMLFISVDLADADDPVPATLDREKIIREINDKVIWMSNSIFTWPFKDNRLHYDETARWAARKMGVPDAVAEGLPTYKVEQAIAIKMFEGMWERLPQEQRLQLLKRLDPDQSEVKDHAAVAVLSGTAAAATLAATSLFAGFAFYTTMSVVISSVAAFLGLTLPFAVFTSASATVAFLASNPIGWALLSAAAASAIAVLLGANARKTAAFVCQVNVLRAMAWKDANRTLP